MITVCPNCAAERQLAIGYAGAVRCACGVKFDGLAHLGRPVPKKEPTKDLTTEVVYEDLPRATSQQRRFFVLSVRLLLFVAFLSLVTAFGYSVVLPRLRPSPPHLAPAATPPLVVLSDVELKKMGERQYFFRARLTNSSGAVANWPDLKISLLAKGLPIATQTLPPMIYLASQVVAGNLPAAHLQPNSKFDVWVNLTFQQDVGVAEDYRVEPILPAAAHS